MYLEVFKPESLINYNPTSFERKVLWEEDESKILLIALEKNQELPEHFSPIDAMIYVLKGKVVFHVEKEEYTLKEEEMFLIPAKTPHKVVAKEKSKFIVCRL